MPRQTSSQALRLSALVLLVAACSGRVAPTTTTTVATVSSAATTPDPTPTRPAADINEFILRFVAAIGSSDDDSLVAMLHGSVIRIFGEESCRAMIATLPATGLLPTFLAEPDAVSVERDGQMLELTGWRVPVGKDGKRLFGDAGLIVAFDGRDSLAWVADCGRVILTPDPGKNLLVTLPGDAISDPFIAPDSWRIEVTASGPCTVVLHDGEEPTAEEVGDGEESFVVQRTGGGTYEIETIGCETVTAIANTESP